MRGYWIFWQGSQRPSFTGGGLPFFVMHMRPVESAQNARPPETPGLTGVAVNANARRLDGEALAFAIAAGSAFGPAWNARM